MKAIGAGGDVDTAVASTSGTGDIDERQLMRLATKGVVQLFNTVAKVQKQNQRHKRQSGPGRKAAVPGNADADAAGEAPIRDKYSFISELRKLSTNGDGTGADAAAGGVKRSADDEEGGPGWDVLRDDFGMGASKMKEWDARPQAGNDKGGAKSKKGAVKDIDDEAISDIDDESDGSDDSDDSDDSDGGEE